MEKIITNLFRILYYPLQYHKRRQAEKNIIYKHAFRESIRKLTKVRERKEIFSLDKVVCLYYEELRLLPNYYHIEKEGMKHFVSLCKKETIKLGPGKISLYEYSRMLHACEHEILRFTELQLIDILSRGSDGLVNQIMWQEPYRFIVVKMKDEGKLSEEICKRLDDRISPKGEKFLSFKDITSVYQMPSKVYS